MNVNRLVHTLLQAIKKIPSSRLTIHNSGENCIQFGFTAKLQKNVEKTKVKRAPHSKKFDDQSNETLWKKKKSPSNKFRSEARRFLKIADTIFQQENNSVESENVPTFEKQFERHFSTGKRHNPGLKKIVKIQVDTPQNLTNSSLDLSNIPQLDRNLQKLDGDSADLQLSQSTFVDTPGQST